jgi:flagellar hook-associated protein 3 FlgL
MAIITRVSTLSLHQRTVSDFTRVQSNLANLQNQISSGVKTDNFLGLVGDVEQFTGLEGEIDKLNTLLNNNTENISRINTTRNVMDSIVSVVDSIENFMAGRNGAAKNNMQFQQQMKDMRQNFTRELNTTLGGRFLLGGTRTDMPPVIDDPVPAPVEIGVPDDSYYQGSKENMIMRPAKNYDVEFDVRADDEAFQKVMGAIAYALQADLEDDDDKFAAAYDMIRDGQEDINAVKTRLDARMVVLEDINERHLTMKVQFTNVKESLITTDILSASTELAINETILQATFQSFSRINALRLVDFLR